MAFTHFDVPLSKVQGKLGRPRGATTLRDHVLYIRSDALASHQARARALLADGDLHGYKAHKDTSRAVIFAGRYSRSSRKAEDPIEHSRLVFCESDGFSSGAEVEIERDRVKAYPYVAAAYISLSGRGVHVVVALDEAPTGEGKALNVDHHRAWHAATKALGLGENNDPSVKNVNRLAYAAHDPGAYLAGTIEPLKWNYELDRAALAQIPVPPEYNDWFGWLPTLRALGFNIQEVDSWSRQGEKYKEGEVERRWEDLPNDTHADARRKLRGHAVNLAKGKGPSAKPKGSMMDVVEPGAGVYFNPDDQGLWSALFHQGLDLRRNLRMESIEIKHSAEDEAWYEKFAAGYMPQDGWIPLSDYVIDRILTYIAKNYRRAGSDNKPLRFSDKDFTRACRSLVADRGVDPVREWMDELPKWDRV